MRGLIPFSPPDIREEDIEAVTRVLRSGWITTGPVSAEFERALVEFTGAGGLVLQNSCTSALEQALRISEVGPGDEVVVPAYTYTATAAAVRHVGANLVLVDTEPGEFTPSPERIAEATTDATKAVIVVDIGGIPYPVTTLASVLMRKGNRSNRFSLDRPVIIDDAAHSLGATLESIPVGATADFTAFSFHAVKNLTTAEGGALAWRDGLVPSNADLYSEMRIASLHGQTKDAFAKNRPGAWEYDIVDTAHKTNMPDVLAALGLSQLRRYPDVLEHRRALVKRYGDLLEGVLSVAAHEGSGVLSSAHLALTLLPEGIATGRDHVIRAMAEAGVTCNVHYKPLPMLSAYKKLGFAIGDFPNAAAVSAREITLPLASVFDEQVINVVSGALREVIGAMRRDRGDGSGTDYQIVKGSCND